MDERSPHLGYLVRSSQDFHQFHGCPATRARILRNKGQIASTVANHGEGKVEISCHDFSRCAKGKSLIRFWVNDFNDDIIGDVHAVFFDAFIAETTYIYRAVTLPDNHREIPFQPRSERFWEHFGADEADIQGEIPL